MKLQHLAALCLLANASSIPAGAQVPDGKVSIVHAWPALSPWVTFMMHLPTGSAICSTVTQTSPLGPSGYSVSFVLRSGAVHFYLTMSDGTDITVDHLQLTSPTNTIADMAVIDRMKETHATVADIPRDVFANQVVPEMLKAQQIKLRAGERSFLVPNRDFAAVVGQMKECAAEYDKLYGTQP